MNGVGFFGERVVMPVGLLHSLLLTRRLQRRTIEGLRERLEERENVLRKALQELAMLRGETDPADFIEIRARYAHPRADVNKGGRPRTS